MTDQLKEAREGLAELRKHDPARADDAYRLLVNVVEQTAAALLDTLPPLHASYIEDDGAFLIEWMFEDRRLGFSFEADPSESGWFYVTKDGNGNSGNLKDMDLPALVRECLAGVVRS
jgi:hypothetical protein